MVWINFTEPDTDEWREWRQECLDATPLLTSADDVDDALYKKQKHEYVKRSGAFHGKCAFCESSLESQDGDIEHFRPKGKVLNPDNRDVTWLNNDGEEINHPGYYWLAYDFENLLPSCVKCNRSRTEGERPIGKRNWFPLSDETTRVATPEGDLKEESPILIHPRKEDPAEHLDIDVETGEIIPRTERGEMCIRIFGLDIRDGLAGDRESSVINLQGLFDKITRMNRDDPQYRERVDRFHAIIAGKTPFSMAARKYWEETLKPKLNDLNPSP